MTGRNMCTARVKILYWSEMEDPAQPLAIDGTQPSRPPRATPSPGESLAVVFGIAAWLLPGLGHALQKMWGRALVVFFAVRLLVYAGASMKGNVFTRQR